MRQVRITLFLLILAQLLVAQDAWNGQAVQAERGILPESGLFAAANDFPRNTFLEVSLPRTGKTVLVEVLKRSMEGIEGSVLLLSQEAAKSLGLGEGESARISATVSSDLRALESTLDLEARNNPDPELNPSAVVATRPISMEAERPGTDTPWISTQPANPRTPETLQVPEVASSPETPRVSINTPPVNPRVSEIVPPSLPSETQRPAITQAQPDFKEPREVPSSVPSPQMGSVSDLHPQFVDVPRNRPRTPEIVKPSLITDPNIPLVAPNPPREEVEPQLARTSPSAAVPRMSASNIPLLAAKPPTAPRVSPEVAHSPSITMNPDSPPAPNTFPENQPRAVSPMAMIPVDSTGFALLPQVRDSVIVSPASRIPENPRVADLPGLQNMPRYVENPRPENPRVADLPRIRDSELPSYVDPVLPGNGLISDLPRGPEIDTPQYVNVYPPTETAIADLPSTNETQTPRYVEMNQPPLGEIADLPLRNSSDTPRYVANQNQPNTTDIALENPTANLNVPPTSSPEIAMVPETATPLETPQATRQQGGLTSIPQRVDSSGRRYVARPQKLEGDILGDIQIVDALASTGHYIQLGTYIDESSIFQALDRIRTYVPMTILTTPRGLRLLSGPVQEGQVGLLLRHYQSQGFRDAYVIRPSVRR